MCRICPQFVRIRLDAISFFAGERRQLREPIAPLIKPYPKRDSDSVSDSGS
jgi:hypothetical protein